MPETSTFEQGVARWLRIKPPQMGAVIAVRAALRAIPALDTLTVNSQPIALLTFRTSAIGWVASRYPAQLAALSQHAVNSVNSVLGAADQADRTQAFVTATAARAAGHATVAAVDSVLSADLSAAEAIEAVKGAVDISIASVFDDEQIDPHRSQAIRISNVLAAVMGDIEVLDVGTNPSQLAASPLWPKGFPAWASQAWGRLSSALHSTGEGWDIWTSWYEARVHGQSANETLELARAMTDEGLWTQGPEIVNTHIKELIANSGPPNPQDSEAFGKWLGASPREWGIALAARAALRTLPFRQAEPASAYAGELLSEFRAVAASRYAAGYPSGETPAVLAAEALRGEGFRNRVSGLIAAFYAASAVYAADETDAVKAIVTANAVIGQHAQVLRDALDLYNGEHPQRLVHAPLWRPAEDGETLLRVQNEWLRLAGELRRQGSHWQVWTIWYDYALKGSPAAFKSRAEWETAFVDLPDPLPWDDGPEAVNTKIAERLSRLAPEPEGDRAAPAVPAQRPAAIEPVWNRGVLSLPKKATKTNLDTRKFAAALKSLRTEMRALANDAAGEANIDKRFVAHLGQLADRIPQKSLRQDVLFRLGHAEAIFSGYAKIVDEQWPEFLASRYHALALHFDRTMRQSPIWREFQRNADQQSLTAEQIAAAPRLATEIAKALRDREALSFIDPALPESLDELAALKTGKGVQDGARLAAIESGKEALAIDIIESVNNILKRIAEGAIAVRVVVARSASEYAQNLVGQLPKASSKLGREHGDKLPKWLFRIVVGGPAMGFIINKFSERFAWFVEHVLPFLR